MCGEKYSSEHFLSCNTVNESKGYQVVRDEMRHRENARCAPDHMINTMARIMIGQGVNIEKIPTHARRVWKNQELIGWRHFIRGRLVKEWSRVKTTDNNRRLITDV